MSGGLLFSSLNCRLEYFSRCGVCLVYTEVCATCHESARKTRHFENAGTGFATHSCVSTTLAPNPDFSDMTNHARPLRRDMWNEPLQ